MHVGGRIPSDPYAENRDDAPSAEDWSRVRAFGIELRKAIAPEKPAEPELVYRAAEAIEAGTLVVYARGKTVPVEPEPCGHHHLYFGLSCEREKDHPGHHMHGCFDWSNSSPNTVTHTIKAKPAEPELETRPCLARRVPGILNSQEGKCVLPLGHAGAHELGNP